MKFITLATLLPLAAIAAPHGTTHELEARGQTVHVTIYQQTNYGGQALPFIINPGDTNNCRVLPAAFYHGFRSMKVTAPAYNSGVALYRHPVPNAKPCQDILDFPNVGSRFKDGDVPSFGSLNANAGCICIFTQA